MLYLISTLQVLTFLCDLLVMETLEDGTISVEEANQMVIEHQGWAESIARSVARAWGMDWRLDGLDGAAMEALIFCSRRYKPGMGVPFRGYARKRIHEASTDAAKKSRGWRRGGTKSETRAREVSAQLFNIFPELREGSLPLVEGDSSDGGGGDESNTRGAIRQLLVGATLIATRHGLDGAQPDEMLDYKRMVMVLGELEPVHQVLMWKIYWEGLSLRTLASEWDTDGLNVIREHKALIEYLYKNLSLGKQFLNKPKVRPGLREIALRLKRDGEPGQFTNLMRGGSK